MYYKYILWKSVL